MSDPYETQIGEYRLVQKLGGGSFSSVHLAEHIHEYSRVAIKILQMPLTKSEDFRDFLNEARTMIRLRHPNIIPLLDVGLSHEDFPFLVMEYASGGTLRNHHPKGSQLPLTHIVEYVEQIASALQYAHNHRIIHRDVKPENMLLRADGTLLLSDFGIAKIIEHSTLMSIQTLIGTPAYMAPEQHKGYPCFASDQYALAVVVYEWISGTRPFQGTLLGLAVQHMTVPPPSLLNLLPALHPAIEQVIFKALSKAPEQRFVTVQEFATALRVTVQQSTVSEVSTNKLPLDKFPSKEAITQQSVAPASIHAEPQTSIPPQPPLANQLVEPEVSQIRPLPAQLNNSPSYNGPYPTSHAPILSSIATARTQSKGKKTSRRFSLFRRNLLVSERLNQRGPAGQYGQHNPKIPGKALRWRRHRGCQIGCLTMLGVVGIIIFLSIITIPRVLAFGSAISATKQPPLSMSGDLSTNNRVNLLIMGYGGETHDGAYLMDSLLVVSLLPQSHHTSLVSVPRGLWIQNPYTTQSKINAIYTVASNNNQNPVDGGKAMTDTVHTATGLDVKYWMTIDFTGFRELINSIGGIDVYVPDSFSANYPKNDDPAIDAGWKVITFTKGNQHMDGETAIEYARARYVTDNLTEASDFARSARQQIIITAVMSRVKQITTWPKLFNALNALQDTIRTNMSFADLAQFSLDMDLNSSQTAHIGLSTDNVMAYGTSNDGQSIVVPQNNDWAAVANYVQQHLYN